MAGTTPRKLDRLRRGLCGLFKSSKASKDESSKNTKVKNTDNLRTSPSTTILSSASVLVPRHQTAASSTHLAATFGSSSEAQSVNEPRNGGSPSDSASQPGQTPVTATEHTAHSQVSKQNEDSHAATTTSIIKARSLWSTALVSDALNDRERETLRVIDCQADADESVSQARSAAEKHLKEKKEKYPKMQKLIDCMDRFKEIGDLIVQYDPVHAALPWAGVRLLLKLCVDRQKTLDAILDGLDTIAGVINRCTEYELLYLREDPDAFEHLAKSMLRLYIAILQFLVKAIDRIRGNGFQGILNMEDISEDLQKLNNLEKVVTSDANVAQAKSTRNDAQELRTKLENMNGKISNMQLWLEEFDRSSILQWISEIPYTKHHKRISEERLKGTGQWIFERQEYK
ncbi:hypothetical protein BZA77DRAFT_264853, partial [Pyronema omphalodes]